MVLPLLLILNLFSWSGKVPEAPAHALYLAVVQVDHSRSDEEAKVLVKVFTDDLRDAVRAAYPQEFVPTELSQLCQRNRQLIEAYFQAKLNFQINAQSRPLSFAGHSLENEVFWLQFRLQAPERWKTIAIDAPFFMELFSTQSNIIQVIDTSGKFFARLTRDDHRVRFAFD